MNDTEARSILQFYYQAPTPERIVELVKFLEGEGVLKGLPVEGALGRLLGRVAGLSVDAFADGNGKLIAFLGEALRGQPAVIDELLALHLPEGKRRTLWVSMWRAGVAKERIIAFAGARSTRFVDALYGLERGDPWDIEIQGPVALDILWAAFFARGDPRCIERIVQALALVAQPERSPLWATGTAALWSLKANAKEHQVVANVCRAILPVTREGLRMMLEQILEGSMPEPVVAVD